MKRKRIQYNELSEEIYSKKYWGTSKLIAIGIILLLLGFILNFSIEDKVNKWLLLTLSNNNECPIIFEKLEFSYFLPKVIIKKPVILGACFGQINNRLSFQTIKLSLHSPHFFPPGIKFHFSVNSGKTNINIYPVISFFSQYLEIEDTKIDTQLFSVMTNDNTSPIGGIVNVDGFLKITSGILEDGELKIKSNNFYLPSQNIKGFELTTINLQHLSIATHFTNKMTMQIDHIEIGQADAPLELKLKGNLAINQGMFSNSMLELRGSLHLSNFILSNFAFLKLFLPQQNTSGTYEMGISGPLNNLAPPKFN